MANMLTTHDGSLRDALHEMAMDDLEEIVPPGEEQRLPEGALRDELIERHTAKRPYQRWELTPVLEAIIRARYDGKTSTIRAIGDELGVPWYTVRDWAQGRLGLRNPADAQPNGVGNLAKQDKPRAASPQRRDANLGTFKPVKPDEVEQSEIEAQRAKRNAVIATVSADDEIRSDTSPLSKGWLTPKYVYSDEMGELIAAQWDGTDTSLAQLAVRGQFPLGVLRGWIDEHHLTPKATPAHLPTAPTPRPLPPVTPLPPAQGHAAERADARLELFTAWLDGAVGGEMSVFLVPASEGVLVLRGPGGSTNNYRVLTPSGDWPDEPISRKLVERIVRLLASGASEASVYGVVYQAEA